MHLGCKRLMAAALTFALVTTLMPATPAWAADDGAAEVAAAAQGETTISIAGELTPETETITVDASGVPEGARLFVSTFTADQLAADPAPPLWGG